MEKEANWRRREYSRREYSRRRVEFEGYCIGIVGYLIDRYGIREGAGVFTVGALYRSGSGILYAEI